MGQQKGTYSAHFFRPLMSPVLYCYKDRKFRKAVLEMLGVRKSNAVQLEEGAARFALRNKPLGSVEQLKESVGYKIFRELLPIPSNSKKKMAALTFSFNLA